MGYSAAVHCRGRWRETDVVNISALLHHVAFVMSTPLLKNKRLRTGAHTDAAAQVMLTRRFKNSAAVVLAEQPAPLPQLCQLDNCVFSSELTISFYLNRLAFYLPVWAFTTNSRPLKKGGLCVTVQPWILRPLPPQRITCPNSRCLCRAPAQDCAARAATSPLTSSSARCECGMKWGTEAGPIDI